MIPDPIPSILWSSWFATLVLVVRLALHRIDRVYRTHWYDPSTTGSLKELEWQQIRDVIEEDPLKHQRRCRCPRKSIWIDLPVFAILFSLVWLFRELILHPSQYGLLANGIQEFTPAVGVFSLAGAALGVFYNVRLTARSKNRQEWIHAIRRHVHTLIADCPPQGGREQEHSKKCEIAALEVLINPSERIHRSFLAIVRFMYGIHDHGPDREILCELRLPTPPGQQVPDDGQITQGNLEELKVKATKLANVLLKREWEQVKHVK